MSEWGRGGSINQRVWTQVNEPYNDTDFQHIMDNNSSWKICSKGHCKIILPSSTWFKQCDICHEWECQLQKASLRHAMSALMSDLDLNSWVFIYQKAAPGSVWVCSQGWLGSAGWKPTGIQVLMSLQVEAGTHKYLDKSSWIIIYIVQSMSNLWHALKCMDMMWHDVNADSAVPSNLGI